RRYLRLAWVADSILIRNQMRGNGMPAYVTCGCGTSLSVRDEDVAKKLACPRCGKDVVVPSTGIQKSPASPPSLARSEPLESEVWEVAEDVDIELPERPRKRKGRRRGLERVNLGLAFHYFLPFVFLTGAGAGLLAVILNMGIDVVGL